MKNLTLVVGLSCVVAVSAWACSDDVTTNPTSTSSTGGSGGAGGAVTASSSSSSSSTSGAGGFDNICDEACNHVEVDCGLAGACALAAAQLMIDLTTCSDMTATCSAECLVDADCGAIVSLATQMPDAALIACVSGCQDDCFGCVFTNCGSEIQACNAVPACQGFTTCFQACAQGDSACFNDCATNNPSAETTALLGCATTNCDADCFSGAGGGGGAGGSGGN
jgi:hypothetical protein